MTNEQAIAIRDYVAAHEDRAYGQLATELNISRQTLINALQQAAVAEKKKKYSRPRGRKLKLKIPIDKRRGAGGRNTAR